MVRVGDHGTVTREMFGGGRHAGRPHAGLVGHREFSDHLRPRVEGALTDHLAHPVVEVDAGRERQIDAVRSQLRRHQPTHLAGEREPGPRVRVMLVSDASRRRQTREALAETLHPAALVVDAHHQRRRARGVDVGDEPRELLRVRVVARKKDHAAHQRVLQDLALFGLQHRALEVDHQGAERHDARSSTAMDSTCVVCGNMSITPAASSR